MEKSVFERGAPLLIQQINVDACTQKLNKHKTLSHFSSFIYLIFVVTIYLYYF